MSSSYRITAARKQDLPFLPIIELAAAKLLEGHAPASVLKETSNPEELHHALELGHLWVALAGEVPVGFAHVKLIENGTAHLEEIDVHPQHGQRGLGTQLVMAVCGWALSEGLACVTLTTFRDPPWNMPFYARLGFERIPPREQSPALLSIIENESRRGLERKHRVAMRRRLPGIADATIQ